MEPGLVKKTTTCPVCCNSTVHEILNITGVPIFCNVLWHSQEEARLAPKGDINLKYCNRCNHVFNSAFDPNQINYNEEYENSLHFSPQFQEYAFSLAKKLIEKYHLRNKDIIEIGCGKGHFLKLLCDLGNNRGIGFDPSYEEDRLSKNKEKSFQVIKEFYSEKFVDYRADMIVCRHVLEHIPAPKDFLNMIHRSIGSKNKSVLFFEVPNVLYTLRDLGIWDLIYEHCGYFSEYSLNFLFKECDYIPCHLEVVFNGQYLCIEALLKDTFITEKTDENDIKNNVLKYIESFHDQYHHKLYEWESKLETFKHQNQKVIIWGGGSKAVTFLNVVNSSELIEYVVDINPHKHDMFISASGQRIIPPEYLKQYKPEKIIIMNPIYKKEIQLNLEQLGLNTEVLVV